MKTAPGRGCDPRPYGPAGLMNFFARWNLYRREKSFYQFIFATDNHAGKPFKPFPAWDFRLRVQPFDHQRKLVARYVSLLDSVK